MEKKNYTLSFEPPAAPRPSADYSFHSDEDREGTKPFQSSRKWRNKVFLDTAPQRLATPHTPTKVASVRTSAVLSLSKPGQIARNGKK